MKKRTLLLLLTILVTASAQKQLVIIHTNDTHSRIEPLPAGDRHAPDKGGVERRINYIEQMRSMKTFVTLRCR